MSPPSTYLCSAGYGSSLSPPMLASTATSPFSSSCEEEDWVARKRQRVNTPPFAPQVEGRAHQTPAVSVHAQRNFDIRVRNAPMLCRSKSSKHAARRWEGECDETGTHATQDEACSLPSSPRRTTRKWWMSEPDGCLERQKRAEFTVELNKILQPQNWKRVQDAINVTRDARWNAQCRSRHICVHPNRSAMWPGRANDELDNKWQSIEAITSVAAGVLPHAKFMRKGNTNFRKPTAPT